MRISLNKKAIHVVLACCFILLFSSASAQEEDSTGTEPAKKGFLHNIFQQVVGSVTASRKDSVIRASILNTKGEAPFQLYSGRIIRHIVTQELGFEKTFSDTTKRIKYFGTRILNALHRDSRDWVIRANLFVKENTPLDPYVLADNERYLRSLDFIQDARILVRPIRGRRDSVDLVIVTKDLFSITGSLNVHGIDRVRARIAENNLMGMGQKLQFTTLADKSRYPSFGYELRYTKNSIAHTFIDGTIGYTSINPGTGSGDEEEKSFYIRLDRQLVSPYTRMAGGLLVSFDHSENLYHKPDTFFYKYRNNLFDVWVGYNLGVTKLLRSKATIRDRSFIALRYLRNNFLESPVQVGDRFDPVYNSRAGVLAEVTFFRQDYTKSNYIYGFGTTEDIPYGFNIAVTGGWYKQLNLARPYGGFDANHYVYSNKGEFLHYFARSGAFFNKGSLQDAAILLGANYFSRLYIYKSLTIREFIKFSYTRKFKRLTFEPLRIDNVFGLESFSADSIAGNQRLSLYAETFAFTKYKFFGFRIAPFVFADISFLSPEKIRLFKSGLYSGLGGGLRTRNENLVFGTMEVRMIYFPRRSEGNTPFKLLFTSNLRFRYNSQYVKAPDIIQLNTGDRFVF